jgi:flagellar motor switch protein FliG
MKANQQKATGELIPNLSQLSGPEKAAILLIALKKDTASEVFKFLDAAEVEMISTEISKVRNIPSQMVDKILLEFYHMVTAREYVLEGGMEYAQAILEKSFGPAKAVEILERVRSLTSLRGFEVLKKADSSQLLNFLNKEHPQTIALILSHLTPSQTANALEELQEPIRSDVAFRIATLGKISPQTLKQIEKVVDEMAGLSIGQSMSALGGTKSLASILNKTSVSKSKEILDGLTIYSPDVALEVKRLMFLFEDIIFIADRDIQKILKDIERKDLALSLKTVDEKLKEKIFANMSERAADLLKEELQFMGMVKLKEVEAAQAKIIDVVKSLEESGEIALNIRANAADVYV